MARPLASIVIAAHDEAAVIERCLDAIAGSSGEPAEFDVTVVANGCSDDTADRARKYPGVRVVELAQPGKAGALNAGDRVAVGFPRIYLDADIVVTGQQLRTLCQALQGGPLVVVPRRQLVVVGRPLLVRAYYAVQVRLPAFENGLFGRGVIALSESARARFDDFPEQVADDLFLDSLFTATEKRQVDGVVSVVSTPRRTRDLLNRLVRVRRGNADLRATAAAGSIRQSAPLSWLVDVVLPRPWLAPAAIGYVGITLSAALLARRPARPGQEWVKDASSRQEPVR